MSDNSVASVCLRSIPLEMEYRRGHADLAREFFIPCLTASREYARAAGYFSSRSLALVAAGLPRLIDSGGSFHLIMGPQLAPEDIAALERGVRGQEDILERALLAAFEGADEDVIVRDRLGFLAWMVANRTLTIKIALPSARVGIFHEKYGLFVDSHGHAVAFTGSPNETQGGLELNYESIDVFRSWTDDGPRVALKRSAFREAWEGKLPGLSVIPLPEAVERKLLTLRPSYVPTTDPFERVEDDGVRHPKRPTKLEMPVARPYQDEALGMWRASGYRGVLAMATGTGKTLTALLGIQRGLAEWGRAVVIVTAPYKHLVDQWDVESRRLGLRPIVCYDDSAAWASRLDVASSNFRLGISNLVFVAITQAGVTSERFKEWYQSFDHEATLIVGDEVHNLGSSSSMASLRGLDFRYRLGLSATPKRWRDEETEALYEYFGEVVYEFPLDRAIQDGFLVPYEYFPHLAELEEDEFARYVDLSRKIARLLAQEQVRDLQDLGSTDPISKLLRDRSSVLNNARSKLSVLAGVLNGEPSVRHSLVYTTPESMEETVAVVSDGGRRNVHRFTYRESALRRRQLLGAFADGKMDALVAIRCLDEGVDVPGTERAYIMASSSNSREFIQRRGRILRKAPGKTRAVIHDFIAVPPRDVPDPAGWKYERTAVRRELIRFREFASLAMNRIEAESGMTALQSRYALLDM